MFRSPALSVAALLCAFGVSVAHAEQLSVQVLSATVKDQKIENANVIVQKNGARSVQTTTDVQGQARLVSEFADDANALIIVKKPGYSDLVAKCPCTGMTYALSPVMQSLDGMRIVLTWGATPRDLDSHLVYPGGNIYFGKKVGADANLDVDNTQSYGPETITVERKHSGQTYVYAVHDFTDINRPASTALSNSQAKIHVYIGESLVRTYYVPTGKQGNLWTVFRITGEGEFQDINTLSGVTVSDPANVLGEIDHYGDEHTTVVAANQLIDEASARALNAQGERAYHAGDLNAAIDAVRRAVDADPNYGQAYSNLGLFYQKAGRSAEAIWAARKAIALASGASASTVRASSYYNIGRLYEDAGDLQQARDNYQSAKQSKANPVYDKAIERVRSKQAA
ncbi:tetratricopeptide repeat protein [Dyella silvatica]|uniref:tetratricopeptide repeat protein n=1 Tax=Dyella silvatica TaxID=2992128 RepID=UPI00224FA22A|nr:tetratricopeptide repeat protein [Dyella silvatica]